MVEIVGQRLHTCAVIAFLLRPFAQVAVSELRKRCAHPVDAGYGGERVIDSGRQGAQRDLDQLVDQELQVLSGRPGIAEREAAQDRSEEQTSELQSLMRTSYAVFCLKKKQKQTQET